MRIKTNTKQQEVSSGCKRAGKTSTMFSPRGSDTTPKSQTILIRTFGWPLVRVARDGVGGLAEDECFGINELDK